MCVPLQKGGSIAAQLESEFRDLLQVTDRVAMERVASGQHGDVTAGQTLPAPAPFDFTRTVGCTTQDYETEMNRDSTAVNTEDRCGAIF